MATIGNLVIALSTRGFAAVATGFRDLDEKFTMFQKGLVGKTVSAAAVIQILDKSLRGIADGLEKAALEGESFANSMADTAYQSLSSIPILGAIGKALGFIIAGMLGWSGEIAENAKRLKELEQNAERMQQKWKKAESIVGILKGLEQRVAAFGVEAEVAMLRASAATEKAIQSAMQMLGQLKAMEDKSFVTGMIEDLEKQVGLFGLNEGAIRIYEAAMKSATVAQFDQIEALNAQIEALEKQKALSDASTALISSLQEQIDTFGMSANQIAIWRLQQQGATEDVLNMARALNDQLDALNKQRELMDRGRQVFEETRTPMERYQKRMEELQELLEAGAIDWETYQRALQKASDEMERTGEKAREIDLSNLTRGVGAIERRNIAGFSDDNSSLNRLQADPLMRIEDQSVKWVAEAKQSNSLLRKSNDLLEEVRDSLDFEVFTF